MNFFRCFTITLFCKMIIMGAVGCKPSEEKPQNNTQMAEKKISFESTDDIIDKLKSTYQSNGLQGVNNWVEDTFQSGTQLSLSRDVTNLTKVDTGIVYDRAIIKLNNAKEETETYYLSPINEDAFSANLFLSVRLNFIEEPFELLLYIE